MRQYIGARYMPKFMGTYDATTAYEALSVVDNGMGTSYVSNQPTPAGTPLTNTTYWAVYGASSGAIIHLQNEIDDISDRISVDISKRKFIFVGDSYNADIFSFDTWGKRLATKLNLLPEQYTILFTSGGGFKTSGTNGTFKDLIDNVSISDPDKITDIIFQGGSNESYNGSTEAQIISAMATCITATRTKFINARIHIGMVGWSEVAEYGHSRFLLALSAYKHCIDYGAIYIENSEYIAHDYSAFYDAGHPDAVGQQRIADYFAEYIINGHFDVDYKSEDVCTYKTGYEAHDTNTQLKIYQHLHNGRVTIAFGNRDNTSNPVNGAIIDSNSSLAQTDAKYDGQSLNPIQFPIKYAAITFQSGSTCLYKTKKCAVLKIPAYSATGPYKTACVTIMEGYIRVFPVTDQILLGGSSYPFSIIIEADEFEWNTLDT